MEFSTNKNEVEQSENVKRLELAAKQAEILDFTNIPELVPAVFNPNQPEKPLFFEGSINAVTGKGGSRKTTFLSILAAQTSKENRVLWIDTEQSINELKSVEYKIRMQGGNMDNIKFFAFLQIEDPDNEIEFLKLFEHIIKKSDAKLIVLDNVTDFNDNAILDINTAVKLTRKLSKIAKARKLAIVTVIHENEGANSEGKGRGHIGSEFVRKSSTVLSVTRHVENNTVNNYRSDVKIKKSRSFIADNMYFEVNDMNLPIDIQTLEDF